MCMSSEMCWLLRFFSNQLREVKCFKGCRMIEKATVQHRGEQRDSKLDRGI